MRHCQGHDSRRLDFESMSHQDECVSQICASPYRIMQIVASGLFDKYLRDALRNNDPGSDKLSKGRILSLKDFYAHFIVLGFGLSSATISLLINYFSRRKKVEKAKGSDLMESLLSTANEEEYPSAREKEKFRGCRAMHLQFFRDAGTGQTLYCIN